MRPLLPVLAPCGFALATVLGLQLGPAPSFAKPDFAVDTFTLGKRDVSPSTPKKRIVLDPDDAVRQHLGVCFFPWRLELAPTPTNKKVRHVIRFDSEPMYADRARAAGDIASLSATMQMKPGKHRIEISLDDERAVSESDESNNTMTIDVEVTGTCSTAKPSYDPTKLSRLAKKKASPLGSTMMLAEVEHELQKVSRLKIHRSIKRATDIVAVDQFEFRVDESTGMPEGPRIALQMHQAEYYLPYNVPRPANDARGWALRPPNWTMHDEEVLIFQWEWKPGLTGLPPLSSLGGGTSATMFINGRPYDVMLHYNQEAGKLVSLAHRVPLGPEEFPLEISIAVATDDRVFLSTRRSITRGTTYDYYNNALAAVFDHDRCKSCHSVGSRSAIEDYHASRSVGRPIELPADDADGCMSCCHGGVLVDTSPLTFMSDWRSPAFSRDIDFSKMTSTEICRTITANLQGDALWHHFRDDPRIHWAVHSGMVPLGHDDKPVLFPGEYGIDEFLGRVAPWISHGSPCP